MTRYVTRIERLWRRKWRSGGYTKLGGASVYTCILVVALAGAYLISLANTVLVWPLAKILNSIGIQYIDIRSGESVGKTLWITLYELHLAYNYAQRLSPNYVRKMSSRGYRPGSATSSQFGENHDEIAL